MVPVFGVKMPQPFVKMKTCDHLPRFPEPSSCKTPMKKRPESHRQWLRFPLYILIIIFLFLPGESPIHPLLEDGKHLINKIFTRKDIQSIFYALENYYMEAGVYPSQEEFDTWLWETFRRNYSLQIPVDRWGEPLIYQTMPNYSGFRLTCRGKDRLPGTKDDFGVEVFYSPPPEIFPEVRDFMRILIASFFAPFRGDTTQPF